ncbi:hypothetical protein J27TS7_11260 [Paenibacillus dendritiformis]|uniref:hypothetical protein n=1 Tax=Paenibacillus dendritiformis TaxID=130049 RepID=UPI001B21C140|nr:hypothetical protein [Paenibacillus dendritiformis]GIO71612.1 hypothetical protein J27TS7_11260 [Paenibacillus dendritiformis]
MYEPMDIIAAIQRVIAARKSRGATPEAIERYKSQVLTIWKEPTMQAAIKQM